MNIREIVCMIVLILVGNNLSFAQKTVINLDKLKEIDNRWKLDYHKSTDKTERAIYRSEKWLMYFIHWRSIKPEDEKISEKYADSLLHNLWQMGFEPSRITGECEVNGHQAFFAETVFRDVFKTRFVVWNCKETGRQFIADCNINLKKNTPDSLFKLQYHDITSNFACHEHSNKNTFGLAQEIVYDEFNISFRLPENWRSEVFFISNNSDKKSPGHYKNGVQEKEGSIWNLLSDSEKKIEVLTLKRTSSLSEKLINDMIEILYTDTVIELQDSIRYKSIYKNFKVEEKIIKPNVIILRGSVKLNTYVPEYDYFDSVNYLYKMIIWQDKDYTYCVIPSLIAYETIWGLPVDLKPTKLQFQTFINRILSNCIKDLPKNL